MWSMLEQQQENRNTSTLFVANLTNMRVERENWSWQKSCMDYCYVFLLSYFYNLYSLISGQEVIRALRPNPQLQKNQLSSSREN
jgi:hypothetical protein